MAAWRLLPLFLRACFYRDHILLQEGKLARSRRYTGCEQAVTMLQRPIPTPNVDLGGRQHSPEELQSGIAVSDMVNLLEQLSACHDFAKDIFTNLTNDIDQVGLARDATPSGCVPNHVPACFFLRPGCAPRLFFVTTLS